VTRPPGYVPPKHQKVIHRAQQAQETADRAFRDAIRAAHDDGASIRELAKIAGVAPNTIRRILDA
jgi:transposase-like protein